LTLIGSVSYREPKNIHHKNYEAVDNSKKLKKQDFKKKRKSEENWED